jgi:SecD/SecF fusion protein
MSDRRRNLFVLLLIAGLIAASAAVLVTRETKLGLDLKGGVQLVYQGKPTKQQPEITQDALDRAVDIIRQRVDSLGVAEPEILRAGRDQIEVNLPGVANAERAQRQVGTTAQMYFYDWEPNVLDEACERDPSQVDGGQTAISGLYQAVRQASKCKPQVDRNNTTSGPQFYGFDKVSKKPFNQGIPDESEQDLRESLTPAQRDRLEILKVNEGIIVVRDEPAPNAKEGQKPDLWWVIEDNPVLQGEDIKNPEQNFDQRTNSPIVTMDFTDRGKDVFKRVTQGIAQRGSDNAFPGSNVVTSSHHFAIRLDNDLISKPYINYQENPEGIDGSNGAQISGGFTVQTAQDLARLLKIGALPIRLELISRSQVSASLGQQALDQGLTAAAAGFIIVALFLLTFYRVLGAIATVALGIYGLYFYALVKLVPVTLTLPGIAGLILTIGVAADANIVIFERVKEEIRAGRSIVAAIATGYKKGFATIVDANVVTLLVAFILFILATAGVKGFAFMLGIGVIVSLLTAVLATHSMLFVLRGSRLLRSRSALGATEKKAKRQFDFMGASRWFFSMSGLILLVCALAIAGRGINFGIDFESGSRITAGLERPATVEQVRDVMREVGQGNAKIQTVDNPELGPNAVQISTEALTGPEIDRVYDRLGDRFGGVTERQNELIGPTFGETVANSAMIAIIASLIVISVYLALRFQWKFAVPVLIALMHDILITAGVYSLTDREVTTSTVAAMLTILGFSLYDTIIVFDRIRENMPRMPSAAFSQIVNRSMSEVIVRSLATSFCTVLPVFALFFFGGETLKDFAFALIVGTASGTYSSVFIAGPVLSHWKQREAVFKTRERRIRTELGYVPAYAVAVAGAPVDVDPGDARSRRQKERSLTAPQDPTQVSREEFDEMVRDLGVEEAEAAKAAAGAAGRRPRGGRRGRPGGGAGPKPPQRPSQGNGPQPPKPKKPRGGRRAR